MMACIENRTINYVMPMSLSLPSSVDLKKNWKLIIFHLLQDITFPIVASIEGKALTAL